MTEEQQHNLLSYPNEGPWYRTRLFVFVGVSIIIALVLVMISMALYASSGAAQLDLSRPGYKSVQNQVEQADTFKSFPASGSVDNKTIEQFKKLYEEQVKQVTAVDAFNPSVLDEQALGIGEQTTPEQ